MAQDIAELIINKATMKCTNSMKIDIDLCLDFDESSDNNRVIEWNEMPYETNLHQKSLSFTLNADGTTVYENIVFASLDEMLDIVLEQYLEYCSVFHVLDYYFYIIISCFTDVEQDPAKCTKFMYGIEFVEKEMPNAIKEFRKKISPLLTRLMNGLKTFHTL